MSLSKYHQDSKSFQPEDLIKRPKSSSAKWQPLDQGGISSFQSEELPISSQAEEQVASRPEALEAKDNDDSPSPETAKKAPPTVAPPKEPEIDLSNYLERTVAEKKIDAAYKEGLQAGIKKTKQDLGTATRALINSSQQLDTIRETIIRNSSGELQEFALTVAEKILRISVCEQDKTIISTIEEALQRSVKSDEFVIYIHPEDYQIVTDNSPELIAGLTGLNNIVIKKDTSIERGGMKIDWLL